MTTVQTKLFEGYLDDIAAYTERADKEKRVAKFYNNISETEFRPQSKTVK